MVVILLHHPEPFRISTVRGGGEKGEVGAVV